MTRKRTEVSLHLAIDGLLHVDWQIKCDWIVAKVDTKLSHEHLEIVQYGTLHVNGKDKVGVVRVELDSTAIDVELVHRGSVDVDVSTGERFGKVIPEYHGVVGFAIAY